MFRWEQPHVCKIQTGAEVLLVSTPHVHTGKVSSLGLCEW